MGQGASGHVLQARLVVHDHVGVILGVLVHLGFQNAIDIAIASLALGPAHDQHVEVVLFDEGVVELHFGVIRLGHARGDRAGLLRMGHLLPDLTQSDIGLHAQDLVEVGVGIRVHNQDGTLLLLAQIFDDHAAGSGFAHTALTGYGNRMRIWHRNAPLKRCGQQGGLRPYRYKLIISRWAQEFNHKFWKSLKFLPFRGVRI